MARAAVKAKQQAQAKAQPAKPSRPARGRRRRGSGGGNPNEQLFFMRLRRGQKWLYALLAIVFAATFAGVGVGSGSGSGLDQLYSGLFGGGSSGSVSKAKGELKKNPAKGYRDLAKAYEAKGDTASAIAALQSYVTLKKNDASAWSELGGLELSRAQRNATRYNSAQQSAQLLNPGQAFQPTGTLGQGLGTNPFVQAATQKATNRANRFYQSATSRYSVALQDYQKAAKIQPHSAQAQFQIATTAQNSGQYSVALAAWKRYLKLDPSSPQKAQIQSIVKQLQTIVSQSQAQSSSK